MGEIVHLYFQASPGLTIWKNLAKDINNYKYLDINIFMSKRASLACDVVELNPSGTYQFRPTAIDVTLLISKQMG